MKPRGVDDFFPFLFDGLRGAVLLLAAYFDESIRTERQEPICVGGYLFKPAGYTRFKKRWHREVLRLPGRRRRFKHFHMTDLCAGHREYEGLDIATRVEILNRAVSVVLQCAYCAVGVQFHQADFERLVPPYWATYRGSIYSSACAVCLQVTAYWLRQWRCHLDVLYVFERGHKFQSEADDILKSIAFHPDAHHSFRYRNHMFEDKEKEVGLQAADLLVWSMTKASVVDGGVIPRAFQPFVKEVIRLGSGLRGRQHLHDFKDDLLRRYLVEQSGGNLFPVKFRPRGKPSLR